jgi:hypothetical protein
MQTCILVTQLGAAATAFLAAYFWYRSASVRTPEALGVARYGSKDDLKKPNPEKRWAEEMSKWNSRGAAAAAVSAVLTAVSLILGGLRGA